MKKSNMITLSSGSGFSYVSSGLFKSSGEWIHPERITDTYEIIFVIKGKVYICEGEDEYTLCENDILLIDPDTYHRGVEKSSDVSFFWMHFKLSEPPSMAKNITSGSPFVLKTLFSQLLHISNTPGYDSDSADLACAMILKEILFQNRNDALRESSLASEIKEWIRLNINKEINVLTVSQVFGYHENHISRVFKAAYGMGIKDYIIELKIRSAESLLQTTLYTIKQIALMTGFKSENHFIKFFGYHKKMTPSEYRNTFVNTHINNE